MKSVIEHSGIDLTKITVKDLDSWYTMEGAANILKMRKNQVAHRCRYGRLRFVKIDRSIFIDPESVADLLREIEYGRSCREKNKLARERWLRKKIEQLQSSTEPVDPVTEPAPAESPAPSLTPGLEASLQLGSNGSQF